MAGIRQGKATQNLLSLVKVLGLLLVVAAGILLAAPGTGRGHGALTLRGAFGLAMVFVLYTYGGWNEAAYISAEYVTHDGTCSMPAVGSSGSSPRSTSWPACLPERAGSGGRGEIARRGGRPDACRMGRDRRRCVGVLIAVSALGTTNATSSPVHALATLSVSTPGSSPFLGSGAKAPRRPSAPSAPRAPSPSSSLPLGALTRKGFETMVDYSLPVFWFFLLLTGLSLFVLRAQELGVARPVPECPLYPLTPLLFCAMCLYMLHSSLAYAGIGAFTGLAVLLAGVPLPLLLHAPRQGEAGGWPHEPTFPHEWRPTGEKPSPYQDSQHRPRPRDPQAPR